MREHPIIMNPTNAQRCWLGLKTQTRRIIRPQPIEQFEVGLYHPQRVDRRGEYYDAGQRFGIWGDDWDVPCPYGSVGSRLWVREAWKGTDVSALCYKGRGDDASRWRFARYMPRWACRTILEITNIRVERVQDISEEDAHAEGVETRPAFKCLWESIHGQQSWQTNPWAWVLTYRRVVET